MKTFKKIAGTGSEPVDHYPEIDQYIPDAVVIANYKCSQKKDPIKWNRNFLDAMDAILYKKGLRIL